MVQHEITRLAKISRKLRREREPAMYGDEETGIAPEELYDEEDAREALDSAVYVYDVISRLLKSYTPQ